MPSIIGDFDGFDWLDWVVDKIIEKHSVNPDEVEECFERVPWKVRRVGQGKYQLLGQSSSGRYLFVIFTWRGRFIRVITARDMDDRERALYRRK